jgi:thiamine pyrophosphate-dependent acetolactate synthase large subunit-like protein
MQRIDCMRHAAAMIGDTPCVVTMGLNWTEWDRVRPSDGNLQVKTLGLCSSIALGLALGMPNRKIVTFDGDGAVLMNLNGLVTVGWMQPKNLIHVVFDNKIYEASGGTPTATAVNANLRELARGAGIRSAHEVHDVEAFRDILKEALAKEGPHFIAAIVEPSREHSEHPHIDDVEKRNRIRIDEVENRYRFIRYLEGLEGRHILEYPADIQPKAS